MASQSNIAKSRSPAEIKLAESLASLEQAVLSPLVSGELQQWTKTVQDATGTLSVDVTTFLRTVLHPQYAEIARNAPDLTSQLAKLTEGDCRLLEETANFLEQLHRFSQLANRLDPQKSETALEAEREKTVEMALSLILSIRKQQAAANTWFEEAQFRDIGVAAD
jgi:hypothetical protein